MKTSTARWIRRIRLATLTAVLAGFVALYLSVSQPGVPIWLSRGIFFALDPLILLEHLLATRTVLVYALVALIPLGLTLVLGRYFCGWLCPFGAIHELVSWAIRNRRRPRRDATPDRSALRFKYLVLTVVIVAALTGITVGGWLDPFALLTRSAAAAIEPGITPLLPSFGGLARVSVQPVILGAIFLLVISLNAWKRRFFCMTLCPLGALYGAAARFSLIRVETDNDCNDCRACSSRCPHGVGPGREHLHSECLVCLACVEDCPGQSVQVKFRWPGNAPRPSLDVGRRQLLGSGALALAFATLPKSALETRPKTKAGYGFLRPPGAVKEELFLERCVRCGQCITACPTSFIQPAEWHEGFGSIWTPVLNAQAGYCEYDCNLCTKACPTGAIEYLVLARKQAVKVGTAVIDKNLCFTYADGFNCTVCVEKCPVPSKPLRFRPVETRDFRGRQVKVQQVYVVPNLCTGCGICEYFCPRAGAPGITITSEDADRDAVRVG